jgi:hypothetical protein
VANGWCWFVLREENCWLVAGGWFVVREKYCWLVADKPSEQGVPADGPLPKELLIRVGAPTSWGACPGPRSPGSFPGWLRLLSLRCGVVIEEGKRKGVKDEEEISGAHIWE